MNVFSVCVKIVTLWTVLISSALANDAVAPPSPLQASGRVALFLLFIIALIVLLAWLLHKTRATRFNGLLGGRSDMKLVSVLSLGLKEKIAVVQVGEKQLVVGITASQITLLTELDKPLEQSDEQAATSFAQLLKKAIRS